MSCSHSWFESSKYLRTFIVMVIKINICVESMISDSPESSFYDALKPKRRVNKFLKVVYVSLEEICELALERKSIICTMSDGADDIFCVIEIWVKRFGKRGPMSRK